MELKKKKKSEKMVAVVLLFSTLGEKTIKNQTSAPPLKKERDEVYNWTHVNHLFFLN
jgi:hypothetical protein